MNTSVMEERRNTSVINILGGSGLGKSTLAAGLFYEMKMQGKSVELVTEYVKQWAWQSRKIAPLDQPLIFGHQSNLEASLYGRVDYIVTDSPLLISPIYEKFYNGESIVEESMNKFMNRAKAKGVVYNNFLLARNKPFDPRGRYETEHQAKQVDNLLLDYLDSTNTPYVLLTCPDRDRIEYIMHFIKEKEHNGLQECSSEEKDVRSFQTRENIEGSVG